MAQPEVAVSCGVVVISNGRILLVKQAMEYGGLFSIPKGGLEEGEDIRSCALRELKEETGVTLRDSDLSRFPEVLHIMNREERVVKRIYYFIAKVDLKAILERGESPLTRDTTEIKSIHLLSYARAETVLPVSQLSVLHHIGYRFSSRELLFLLRSKLITRNVDLDSGLYIYNYSQRCKELKYWNFTTLSCRGLVLDRNFNVVARPFKKFFEWRQLPIELREYLLAYRTAFSIQAYDKLDGTLIVLFNHNGQWLLTNRRKWGLIQSHQARILFHRTSSGMLGQLDPNLTYLFESTIHYQYNVLTYDTEKLVLLCAVDKVTGDIYSPERLNALFSSVRNANALEFDSTPTETGIEGYVFLLDGRYMIKTKSHWYDQALSQIRARGVT